MGRKGKPGLTPASSNPDKLETCVLVSLFSSQQNKQANSNSCSLHRTQKIALNSSIRLESQSFVLAENCVVTGQAGPGGGTNRDQAGCGLGVPAQRNPLCCLETQGQRHNHVALVPATSSAGRSPWLGNTSENFCPIMAG